MPRHEQSGIGHLIQALSLKMSDIQNEIAGLRQDVRTLTYLVRELQATDERSPISEPEADEEADQRA